MVLYFRPFGNWLADRCFLIAFHGQRADYRFVSGSQDYGLAWLLLALGGFLGLHRFYQGKIISGIVYLLTGGLFLMGVVYDVFTLNGQIDYSNRLYRAGY